MSRRDEYLAYHRESARVGDIDPSYSMLLYVCDRFELTAEQRYWLAFLYALTYCGASVYYAYNEWPDFENVDSGRLARWWKSRGRAEMICQTDRRWVRSSNLFVPAVESYRRMIGRRTQHEFFSESVAQCDTPESRYDTVYRLAAQLYTFGQFSLFLYLEALHTITPLRLAPTDLDLSVAHSCRNGLCYAYGLDEAVTDGSLPLEPDRWALYRPQIQAAWDDLRAELGGESTVWNLETTLCAYKKFVRGDRYIGYYLDRQAIEIAKMADHVRDGVAWDVLWQYRVERYEPVLVELTPWLSIKGVSPKWRDARLRATAHKVGQTQHYVLH